MKATPVFVLDYISISLTPAEAQRALTDPGCLTGIISGALEHSKTAPSVTDQPEPAAVRTTKAAKAAKPAAKGRGASVPTYDCAECDRTFTSEKRLANHIRKTHEGDASADED